MRTEQIAQTNQEKNQKLRPPSTYLSPFSSPLPRRKEETQSFYPCLFLCVVLYVRFSPLDETLVPQTDETFSHQTELALFPQMVEGLS